MRALILSDIHCVSRELMAIPNSLGYHGVAGSSFYIEDRSPTLNRILSISNCLKDEVGKIDALLCLGDFAHQSKQLPFLQSWTDIKEIAATLAIPVTIGITGNHDIASRVENMEDAESRIDFLRSVPGFPFRDPETHRDYFASGVCSVDIGSVLVIAIDTCRTHGFGKDEATNRKIWSRGHITQQMIDEICKRIQECNHQHIVLMMHHHPEKVDQLDDPDFDQMQDGPQLMTELARFPKAIFVLHGHKHLVRLKHASTGLNPPIVLSAASLAAHPYPGYGQYHANQFHILEIDTSEASRAQGRVLSWDWGSSRWEPSKKPDMPHSQRFGPIISLSDLADKLGKLTVVSQIDLAAIRLSVPEIDYFQVSRVDDLNNLLAGFGYEIIPHKSEIFAMVKK